jgi:uncharacterized membrane protein HdeD (DUF308 family)
MLLKQKNPLLVFIIYSLFLLIVGLFLFIRPEVTIVTISYVIGISLIILGFSSFTRYLISKDNKSNVVDCVYGVISMIVGVCIILYPSVIVSIVPFILGVVFIINSSIKLRYSLILKEYSNSRWLYSFIISLITLICGIVLAINPFKGAIVITKLIGLFIIIYSSLDLINSLILKANMADNKDKKSDNNVLDAEIVEEKSNEEK